jgi:hypothetical protein
MPPEEHTEMEKIITGAVIGMIVGTCCGIILRSLL